MGEEVALLDTRVECCRWRRQLQRVLIVRASTSARKTLRPWEGANSGKHSERQVYPPASTTNLGSACPTLVLDQRLPSAPRSIYRTARATLLYGFTLLGTLRGSETAERP